jgi:hypothetical protein
MPLLYICAQWHALAKLRLQNDFTLDLLDYTTTILGAQMRRFHRDVCSKVATRELQREAEARAKREAKERKGGSSTARKPATLGIFTIKFHFLGDYVPIIRKYGTTDSFSTQTVGDSVARTHGPQLNSTKQGELYHRDPKTWFLRTDRKAYEEQLSHIERRQRRLRHIRSETSPGMNLRADDGESLDHGNGMYSSAPSLRYSIGTSQNAPMSLNAFLQGEGVHKDPYLVVSLTLNSLNLKPR